MAPSGGRKSNDNSEPVQVRVCEVGPHRLLAFYSQSKLLWFSMVLDLLTMVSLS